MNEDLVKRFVAWLEEPGTEEEGDFIHAVDAVKPLSGTQRAMAQAWFASAKRKAGSE